MEEFSRRINLVIFCRVSLTLLIFINIYLTNFFGTQNQLSTIFYAGLLVFLFLNLPLLPLTRLTQKYRQLVVYSHLANDFALISFIVFTTAGSETPFSLLYIFMIMYSSLFLTFSGIVVVTCLTCLNYLIVQVIRFYMLDPSFAITRLLKSFLLSTEVNLLGFVLVGLLVGFLAERLRKTSLRMKQQSDRIQDLSEYNAYIIENIRSGLITTDTDFNIVMINQTGCRLLNLAPEDLIGQNVFKKLLISETEKTLIQFPQHETRAVRIEKWLHLQSVMANIYLGLSISPIIIRGEIKGYIIIFQDLTEIKKLETEMEIQKKMAAIGNLAAAIAHEIRNPLASMMGSIQVLSNQLKLSSSQRHLMEITLRESHRLDRIIANFLQYASNRKFSPKYFDIASLVKETITLFQNSPEIRADHRIVFNSSGSPSDFFGDPDQIKQVIWNLCTNAVKAMPRGGEIRITCSNGDNFYIINFQDTGRGMSEDEIQKIFEPFQSRFQGGLGLGMAIVYRIVADHGGRIEVNSHPGGGTIIQLFFPKSGIRNTVEDSQL